MSDQLALLDTPPPPHAVPLTRRQIRRAQQLSNALYACGDDVYFWCEELGYKMFERTLPKNIPAVLKDGYIILSRGMSQIMQVIAIAHEIFHHEFHGAAIAFRELTPTARNLNESQADSFAVLVAEPSVLKYDTIQQFYTESELPDEMKPIREALLYLIKV